MNDKPIAFLVYAIFGCFLAAIPTIVACWLLAEGAQPRIVATRSRLNALLSIAGSAAILMATVVLIAPSAKTIAVLTIATAWSAWRMRVRSAVAILLMLCLLIASSKIVWWDPSLDALTHLQLVLMLLLFITSIEFVSARSEGPRRNEIGVWAIFGVLCLFLAFSTGLYHLDEILFTTWHHWSSYIGPAELMRAGARIFYDTPVQYGLGPTSLIAMSCSVDCWTGMYFIVGFANVMYAALIAYVAIRLLGSRRSFGTTTVVLAAILAACFLYTSYSPSPATPAISPSTGGLRFIPCALLLAYLAYAADRPWNRLTRLVGHLLWAVGLFWAPESAFQVTFIWWPYYLWRSAVQRSVGLKFVPVLLDGIGLMATFIGALAIFAAGYFALYHVLPTRDGVFAYILYPPGPIPFDFRGAFVFFSGVFLLVLSCIFVTMSHRGDRVFLARSLPVLFGLYAVGSYYLGRSIDNNLLNLTPFVVLALIVAVATPGQTTARFVGLVGLCSIIGATASFGWHQYWKPAVLDGTALTVSPRLVSDTFTFANSGTAEALDRRERPRNPLVQSANINAAIEKIWVKYQEPVTLVAPPLVLVTSHSEPWSAIHVPANFWFMPSPVRQAFLARSMERLKRSGWVLVQLGVADQVAEGGRELITDLDAIYTRDITLQFGSYTAIRYLVK